MQGALLVSERPAPEHTEPAQPAQPVPAGLPDSTVPPPPPPSQPAAARGKGRRGSKAWSIGPPAHLLQGRADTAAGAGDHAPGDEQRPRGDRVGQGGQGDHDETASHGGGQRETSNWRDASLLRNLLGS